ncbi:hypothetical protein D3C87_1342910 [compost metagenome]
MNCIKCNAPNLPEARFCGNCGADLAPQVKTADNYAIKALLVIMGIEYLSSAAGLLIQKLALPFLSSNGNSDSISFVYSIYGWTSDILAIAALLVFMITVKNNQVKTALIIFFVLRIVFLIGYRLINFPM